MYRHRSMQWITTHRSAQSKFVLVMSGGSSSGKGGKGGRKGGPIIWEGSLGPEEFAEAVYEFPVQTKSDFGRETPLRGYDSRKEEWPKCMHGEDCVVQMMDDGVDGGRRFFKCPYAWSSKAPDNCKFVRWVDPSPIFPHQEYIYYLQHRIQELEMNLSTGNKDDEDDDDRNSDDSQEPQCNDPYCSCPCHKKKGGTPPPPPPPPPPQPMGGYYGEGSTQYAMWGHY